VSNCIGEWNVLPWREEPLFQPVVYGRPYWQVYKPTSPAFVVARIADVEEANFPNLETVVLQRHMFRYRHREKSIIDWEWRYAAVYYVDGDTRALVAFELFALAMHLAEFIYTRCPCVAEANFRSYQRLMRAQRP
jgi:hypothetical protein